MISVEQQAAEVIAEYTNTEPGGDYTTHLARALADAGLLAPELPDPSVTRADPEHIEYYEHNHPDLQAPDVWDIPELSSYYLQAIGVFPGRRSVQPWADGEPEEPVTPEDARAIAYYWLAAARYAEEGK